MAEKLISRFHSEIKSKFVGKFEEEIRFFKGWIDQPKAVGSILPTSATTAAHMASVGNPDSGLPVLELGPGTGVITAALLRRGFEPGNIHTVEYSSDFVTHLKAHFPDVNVHQGDAFDVEKICEITGHSQFDSVVSGIPLLNFPSSKRVKLIQDLLKVIPKGRPIVQISYGPLSPVIAGRGGYSVEHHKWVARNVPPAQLWVYRAI